jgi:hypothetical protein
LAGRERELGETLRIRRPRHDVDALTAEFLHHRLHARALEAHAGADRIDAVVRETTAILVRLPTSREAARISTMP